MSHRKVKICSIIISSSLLLTACNQDISSTEGEDYNKKNDTNTSFNQLSLIENLTDNVITPTFENFQLATEQQINLVKTYCSSEQSFANAEITNDILLLAKISAQNQWRTTMNTWQQVEQMQLGPLTDNDGLLKNKIYSWPTVNSCGVDTEVIYFKNGEINGQPYNINLRTTSRKGLDALEYLLFNESLEHSCTDTAAPTGWSNFTDTERKIARCNFAVEVAKDISNNASILVDEWSKIDGYAEKLKAAGSSESFFTTEHDAVNKLSDAMFYIDLVTKDLKLATPLGLLINSCGSSVCVEEIESPYSHNSIQNIQNNLLGFEKLLTGNNNGIDGIGFIEYLIDVGDISTATDISNNVTNVLNALNKIETNLADALENNADNVEEVHTEVKKVTDQLKADFITSLALELPKTAAGDND